VDEKPGAEISARRYLAPVEEELRRVLLSSDQCFAPYYAMMHYHFGWVDECCQPTGNRGGKRLRPLLCLLACEAAGGDLEHAVPAAAAVEIIHNFSLAHDDIQDGDPTRRHRPTLWKVWGMPQALNVGDGLFALAHLAMEGLLEVGVSVDRCLLGLRVLNRASLALIQGQYLDVSFEERQQVDEEEYLTMVAGKTAALIACATELGALLATDESALVERYRRFGQHLGFAFQMTPVVYALGKSPALREIYSQNGTDGSSLAAVLDILEEVGARQYTESLADEYKRRGLADLASTGLQSRAQDQLGELAEFLTFRSY
jgi:geranylgeranyl diphosphate synthase type I